MRDIKPREARLSLLSDLVDTLKPWHAFVVRGAAFPSPTVGVSPLTDMLFSPRSVNGSRKLVHTCRRSCPAASPNQSGP